MFGIKSAAYAVEASMASKMGQGNYTLNATGSLTLNAIENSTLTVGGAHHLATGSLYAVTAGGAIMESAGAASSEVVGGQKTIDAHEAILFRCGKSEIEMKPDGTIHIRGVKLLVDMEEQTKITAGKIELN